MSKPSRQEILNNLSQFTGTDGYHRYMGNMLLTDGTRYMAEACGAFWLLDTIYSVQTNPEINKEEMQVCKLKMTGENTCVVTITDGHKSILHEQDIQFTDFPLDEITLWATVQDKHRVILLPSEY